MSRYWARRLGLTGAAMFMISSAFPITAGLARDPASFPRWWGVVDVVIAFALGVVAVVVMSIGQRYVDAEIERSTYRAYRVLIHGIFAVLVIFFLVGDRISWIQCLTGIAWRAWLLLYALPTWLGLMRGRAIS